MGYFALLRFLEPSESVAIFVAVVLIGAITAGCDVRNGVRRKPCFYLQKLCTFGCLPARVLYALLAIVLVSVVALTFETVMLTASPERERTTRVFLAAMVMAVVGALTSELAMLGVRSGDAMLRRHAERARRGERNALASLIHDTVLADVEHLAFETRGSEFEQRVAAIAIRLRTLQHERQAAGQPRRLRECLARPMAIAAARGIDGGVRLAQDDGGALIGPDVAHAIEHAVLVQVGNSVQAGSTEFECEVWLGSVGAFVRYADDGPGFDVELACRGSGGIGTLVASVEQLGGSFSHSWVGERLETVTHVPCDRSVAATERRGSRA